MKKLFLPFLALCVTCAACTTTSNANAGEIKAGVMRYDGEIFGLGGKKGKETGEAVSLEYRASSSPEFLKWAKSPRPWVAGTVNLNGNTSHISAGVSWRGNWSEKFYGEYGFGLGVHNGTKEVPSPNVATTPQEIAERVYRKETEIEFGSTALFRNAFILGYKVNEDWAVEAILEHHSNGKIFDDVNEGVDNFGMRVARTF